MARSPDAPWIATISAVTRYRWRLGARAVCRRPKGKLVNRILVVSAVAGSLALAACGGHGDDKLADRVEAAADQRADALENRADVLDDKADQVRKAGERRGTAIDAADLNVDAMSKAQKDAIVANQAAAVR